MHFHIFIADHNVEIFMDMVHMFKEGIRRHPNFCTVEHTFHIECCKCHVGGNCTSHIPSDFNDGKQQFVTFGGGLHRHTIPPNSIITIFDFWDWNGPYYLMYAPNNLIYTYSHRDMMTAKAALKEAGKGGENNVFVFDFCYSSALDGYQYKKPEDKEYDVCFYGGPNERRQAVTNSISDAGLRVFYGRGWNWFGETRANLLNNSKIMVAIYSGAVGFANSSGCRIFPAISNGAFVVAEVSSDDHVNETLRPYCILCTAEEMPTVVKYWATHDDEREALRTEFHQRLKDHIPAFDFSPFISRLKCNQLR